VRPIIVSSEDAAKGASRGQRVRARVESHFRDSASRAAACDVYSDQLVPGAREWVATGDPGHLSRPYRARLTIAASRIAKWMAALESDSVSERAT